MFHGPIREVVPFFESMGFKCPDRKDHASFLQEVTTPKGKCRLSYSFDTQGAFVAASITS